MITPEVFIESVGTYRKGHKTFCKLASLSDKDSGMKEYFGFGIEVIKNDAKLVLSIEFDPYKPVDIVVFHKREHLEDFIEVARLYVSNKLNKILRNNQSLKLKI